MDTPHEKIRDLAYALWQEDGSPEGNADYYWTKAEQQLAADRDLDLSDEQSDVEPPPLLAGLPVH